MNKQEILQYIDKKFQKKEPVSCQVGDTVRVHFRITEGDSTRVQAFEGVVVAFTGQGGSRNVTVRKISFGVGVERTFPLNTPAVEKLTVIRSSHVRRAKLYYLRDRAGKAARLTEKDTTETDSAKSASGTVLSGAALGKEEVASAPAAKKAAAPAKVASATKVAVTKEK